MDFALGWLRDMSIRISWGKSVPLYRRKCTACSHVCLEIERSVGDIAAPLGVCTPIVTLHKVFHGEVDGTREMYGHVRGIESLQGSPSTVII